MLVIAALGQALHAASPSAQPRRVPGEASKQARPTKRASAKGEPAEELKEMVARRIHEMTGHSARIGDLVYEVFTSSFVGHRIAVGPRARPLLSVPELTVKLVIFSGRPETTLALVQARRPSVRLPAGWIVRPYRYALEHPATVRKVLVRDAQIVVILGKRRHLELSGVEIELRDLKIPRAKAGRPPPLTGGVTVRIKRVAVAGLELSDLVLEGSLDGKGLQLSRLKAALFGGELALKGRVGLGPAKGGLGPFDLAGSFDGRPFGAKGPILEGTVTLAGPSITKVRLAGRLAARPGQPVPRRGGTPGAPAVGLDLQVGGRTISGTWRRWRAR